MQYLLKAKKHNGLEEMISLLNSPLKGDFFSLSLCFNLSNGTFPSVFSFHLTFNDTSLVFGHFLGTGDLCLRFLKFFSSLEEQSNLGGRTQSRRTLSVLWSNGARNSLSLHMHTHTHLLLVYEQSISGTV